MANAERSRFNRVIKATVSVLPLVPLVLGGGRGISQKISPLSNDQRPRIEQTKTPIMPARPKTKNMETMTKSPLPFHADSLSKPTTKLSKALVGKRRERDSRRRQNFKTQPDRSPETRTNFRANDQLTKKQVKTVKQLIKAVRQLSEKDLLSLLNNLLRDDGFAKNLGLSGGVVLFTALAALKKSSRGEKGLRVAYLTSAILLAWSLSSCSVAPEIGFSSLEELQATATAYEKQSRPTLEMLQATLTAYLPTEQAYAQTQEVVEATESTQRTLIATLRPQHIDKRTPYPIEKWDVSPISDCIQNFASEYCVLPIGEKQEIVNELTFFRDLAKDRIMVFEKKGTEIPKEYQLLMMVFDQVLENEQTGTIPVDWYRSRYPADIAAGGVNWQEARSRTLLPNETPNAFFAPEGTPTPVTQYDQRSDVYLPQGDLGADVHEIIHLGLALLRVKNPAGIDNFVNQEKPKDPYTDLSYEEYQVHYLGSLIETMTDRFIGVDQLSEKKSQYMKSNGIYYPQAVTWLNENGVNYDDPLFRLIYNFDDYCYYQDYIKMWNISFDQNTFPFDRTLKLELSWRNHPWSKEEKEFIKWFRDEGVRGGWLDPRFFPTVSTTLDKTLPFLLPDY